MKAASGMLLLQYLAAFCIAACYPLTALAQSFGAEAVLLPDRSIYIPALKAGNKFYEVRLAHQAPAWGLASALDIFPVDSEYLTGSYENNVLHLRCIFANGNYYSAQLQNATPGGYSFRLVSLTQFNSCAAPADVGPVRGAWKRTADSPLSARNGAAITWTGKEIVVFGGSSYFCPLGASCAAPTVPPFADGAAYDPVADAWRKIQDAPTGVMPIGIATLNSDIFVLAQTGAAQVAIRLFRYRSSQNRWDEFELPTSSVGGMTITEFGNDILLYSQTDRTGFTNDWRLDTSTGRWTSLSNAGIGPSFARQYVDFGQDLYLFYHALTAAPNGADGPSYLRAARLRGQQWKLLPVADSIGQAPDFISGNQLIAPALGCADGGSNNNFGRCIPYGAVFDTETDTWRPLPNAPGRGFKYLESSGVLSMNDLMLHRTGRPALDTFNNQWFMVPLLDSDANIQRSLRAVGRYGFAFGGVNARGVLLKESWIWKP